MDSTSHEDSRILLVEDEALVALSEKNTLESHGYEALVVHSGEEAVEKIKEDSHVSLVLMDIDLGSGIDGTEAARQILELRELPIIFLTNHAESSYVEWARTITNYGYVLKDSGEFVLIESIQMAYQLFDSHQKLKAKEEQLSLAIDAEDHGYWDWNVDTNEAYFSPRYCEMLGYEPAELPMHYHTWEELLHPEDKEEAIEHIREKLRRLEPFELEFRLQTKSGQWKWIRGKGSAYYADENGKPHRVVGTHEDISERKQVEDALNQRTQFLERVLDTIPDIIGVTDLEGKLTYHSDFPEDMGYGEQALVGRNVLEFVHPADSEAVNAALGAFVQHQKESQRVEYRFRCADGHYVWMETKGTKLEDEYGRTEGLLFSTRDVTHRKETEQRHRDKEEQYRLLAENARDVVIAFDGERNPQYVSPSVSSLFGYSANEVREMGAFTLVHPADRDYLRETIKAWIQEQASEGTSEFRVQTKSGEIKWVESRGKYLYDESGNPEYIILNDRDITDRKRLEEQLRESEEHYRVLAENVQDAIARIDLHTELFTYVSPSFEKRLGYTREEALSITKRDIITEESYVRHSKALQEAMEKGEPSPGVCELEAVHKDGHTVPVEVHPTLIRDENGTPTTAVTVIRDITERKRLEEELRQREGQYRLLAENALDIVYSRDIETERLTYISPSVERVLGYSQEEMYSLRLTDLLTSESYARNQKTVEETIHKKQKTNDPEGPSLQLEMIHKNGSTVPVETRSSLVRDENGEIIAVSGVARDISERKQKEKQLEEMYSRLQKVIDNAPFLINEIDPEGYYTLASEATCRFLGLSKEELIGKHFRDVLPQEIAETFQQRITQVYASGEERTVDDRLTADGEEHVFRTTLCPVYRDDKMIQSIVGIGYDATKQVEALQQKDFLLRELNHRVKNNLRMVSSLVELKDSALGDTVDLSDIRHQVQAIEKVHASLQESDQITHIQLKRYVEDILSTVFPSFTNQGVTIENEVLDISIRTKAAVPIGLIINETATNAIKHGFTGEEDARFSVTMEADAEERNYVLTISNTGQPLPEDVDIKNPQTLGLQLIQALVSQLQGTLAVERRPNPTFTIRFPKSQT